MNNNDFIAFSRFETKEAAINLGELLKQNEIEFLLEDNSAGLDMTFSTNELNNEYLIKLRKEDFTKANKILLEITSHEIHSVAEGYYLLDFTNEELIEVVSKPDEWNRHDFLLAQKLLRERGVEIDETKLLALNKQRIAELSRPEKAPQFLIYIGYIFAVLGVIIGFFIGWHLFSRKKILPNGSKVYGFTESDRAHGNRILLIALFLTITAVFIRILLFVL